VTGNPAPGSGIAGQAAARHRGHAAKLRLDLFANRFGDGRGPMTSRDRAARLRRQASARSAAVVQEAVRGAAEAIACAGLEAGLTRQFGVAWVRRPGGGREIAGISQDLLDQWSGPGSIPAGALASLPEKVFAAARAAARHGQADTPSEPIVYPVPGVRGLTEAEAWQMMADGLMSVQAEKPTWTRYDLLRHIAWSVPVYAFTTGDTLEALTGRALEGAAGIRVELVSRPGPLTQPDGRRYRIERRR